MTALFDCEYCTTDGRLWAVALPAASWDDAFTRAAELSLTVCGVMCATVDAETDERTNYPDFPNCPAYLMNHPNAKKWGMP